MTRAESTLSTYLRFHVHHRLQCLVQGEMTPLLHRLDKRNKPILPTLLSIRALVADWAEGADPLKDYKDYSRKQGGVTKVRHPARVVGPAASQLFILRAQLSSLCDSGSELRKKTSLFGKADLEKAELEIFQLFYVDSFHYSYALNYVQTLAEASDLSDFWYREHYLEMTRCIQFPIEMSLPWILTEHLLLRHVSSAPLLESVLFLLDCYNDAAHRALYELNQQFLYDEIEAEANLVIDQLYFLLCDEVYAHYKNLSAAAQLDMHLKNKLELLKGTPHLTVDARRYEALLSQKHIQLLGRSINFSFILGQNVNNKIYRDIDFAIKRFEASDARAIVELRTLLDVIAGTHARLSQFLALDSFDTMLRYAHIILLIVVCT
jgi:cytoplasmic FMR1 interacting protein